MLTYHQKLWLFTRGGRTARDAFYINGKPHISMRGNSEDNLKRINIPTPIPDKPRVKKIKLKNGYRTVLYRIKCY